MPLYGEVVLAAGGTYSTKPRPVLVVQDEDVYTGDSILVIPFTTATNPDITCRVAVTPSDMNGLDRSCQLETDKLSAINRSYITHTIGKLEPDYLQVTGEYIKALLRIG
jgi:mRNA interferase MazF